ncbi:hypothetical protein H8E88_23015, partial [candidate division KSB1 bacterium]|nr:hypothetical protein [candidate division KSB1 bacterium]
DAQSIPPLAIIGMVASVSGPVYAIFQYLAPGGFGKFKKFMTAQEAREVATEYNKKLTNEMP